MQQHVTQISGNALLKEGDNLSGLSEPLLTIVAIMSVA